MLSRRSFLQSSAAAVTYLASGARPGWAANAPGISDTEIKIGQTMPYSGPASAYGVIGRTEGAYFRMINETGGVNGRKLNLISLDDGYSPQKTVEQTRRLVEQEKVALIFGSVGTPTNDAVRSYLNDNKVPQLLIASGSNIFGDPEHYPWTMGAIPNYQTEAHIFAKHILQTKPDAKIGVLFQNDGFGKDYAVGLRDGLGADHEAMIIKEVSYEVSDPTVDSQVITLQSAGVDTLIIAAAPKAAAQAIRKAYDIGWAPVRYMTYVSASITATLRPAGLDKSKGLIIGLFGKDPTDPRWKDDPGYKEWVAFVSKYLTPSELVDLNAVAAFSYAAMLIQVLKQCGDDLSRQNVMRQAANLRDLELPMLLTGIKVNTSPDNFYPIRQMQLATFNGESWELFGDVISG
ncbi:ABC transporter substrate-binding protein [Rhodoblastus sp.]|uniref:ABC transporter substrate-binding protein n=1 Tax=Rhodoblastus sp. TaxID=1962975 RepID=UPI003F9DC4DF